MSGINLSSASDNSNDSVNPSTAKIYTGNVIFPNLPNTPNTNFVGYLDMPAGVKINNAILGLKGLYGTSFNERTNTSGINVVDTETNSNNLLNFCYITTDYNKARKLSHISKESNPNNENVDIYGNNFFLNRTYEEVKAIINDPAKTTFLFPTCNYYVNTDTTSPDYAPRGFSVVMPYISSASEQKEVLNNSQYYLLSAAINNDISTSRIYLYFRTTDTNNKTPIFIDPSSNGNNSLQFRNNRRLTVFYNS